MIALFALVSVLALSPTPNPADAARIHKADAQKAIDAGNVSYIASWQHADAHAFAQLFTVNAASIDDNGVITRGRSNIEAQRAKIFARLALVKGTITTEDLVVDDDIAYEMGSYSFTLQAAGKTPVVYTGRYLTIWQQQADGGWLIKTDSGLSDRTCTKNPGS